MKHKPNRYKVTIQKQSRTFRTERDASDWANKLGRDDVGAIDIEPIYVEDELFP